jgi:hypothetical protein
MTVTELLVIIARSYPGATPEALASFKPVFQARFAHREGPHLAAALHAVMASFSANSRKPFPIPSDIEAHMPALRSADDSGGKPIREALEARNARAVAAYADWYAGQGRKIKANRPRPVFDACVLEALSLAGRRSPLVLKAEEIATCEQRALSQARVAKFGRIPNKAEEWESQIAQVRTDWAALAIPEGTDYEAAA